jgi:twitching motility protein PilT
MLNDSPFQQRLAHFIRTHQAMTRLLPDPELDQLVRELNEREAAAEGERSQWPAAQVPSGNPLEALLLEVARRGASDLLLINGSPPVFRVGGRLVRAEEALLSDDDVAALLDTFMTLRIRQSIAENGAVDFSLRLAPPEESDERRAWRFRVNIHRQRGTLAASFRALPTAVPTIAELKLPPILAELVKPTRGLVLVCGPTGAGKTTTLAAMIGAINKEDSRHIITIEDPIEYEHRNSQSVIEQIEVGRDAPSFASALRAALRQDPDVILVGEMRDLETVATALTAAETGHLILSTLHTSDVAQAIHRIVDVFPPGQQTQIRQQLSLSLNAVIVQQLIPTSTGTGRAVAVEVLLANAAIRNHIRRDKMENLISEITLGKRQGMISIEDSLARLVRQGVITADEAKIRSARPDELESQLRT